MLSASFRHGRGGNGSESDPANCPANRASSRVRIECRLSQNDCLERQVDKTEIITVEEIEAYLFTRSRHWVEVYDADALVSADLGGAISNQQQELGNVASNVFYDGR